MPTGPDFYIRPYGIEGPVAVGTVWLHNFIHLTQVSAEQTMPRRELGEVEVHLTPFSEQPVIHEWDQPGCPSPSCFLFPSFLPSLYGIGSVSSVGL